MIKKNNFQKLVNSRPFFYFVNYGIITAVVMRLVWIIASMILGFVDSKYNAGGSPSGWFIFLSIFLIFIYVSIIRNCIAIVGQKSWIPTRTAIYLFALIIIFFFIMFLSAPQLFHEKDDWTSSLSWVLWVQIIIRIITFFFLFFYLLYWKQDEIGSILYKVGLASKQSSSSFNINRLKAKPLVDNNQDQKTPINKVEEAKQSEQDPNDNNLHLKEIQRNSWLQLCNVSDMSEMTKLKLFQATVCCLASNKSIVDKINDYEQFVIVSKKENRIIGIFKFYSSRKGAPVNQKILDYFANINPNLKSYINKNESKLLARFVLNVDFATNLVNTGYYRYCRYGKRTVMFVNEFNRQRFIVT